MTCQLCLLFIVGIRVMNFIMVKEESRHERDLLWSCSEDGHGDFMEKDYKIKKSSPFQVNFFTKTISV